MARYQTKAAKNAGVVHSRITRGDCPLNKKSSYSSLFGQHYTIVCETHPLFMFFSRCDLLEEDAVYSSAEKVNVHDQL